ncbi:hypothetical protein CABS01_04220 [Colletotrichum abscissum]|uniref:Uncharacterized protein n=1 Tax=Colletotrichum abscissum TaxID=1671311 RepID=A0A9P9XM97_9PEZI|nr:uncharacterized protein CABS01_04220 [Colletotrichum abscissum]KAI3556613.1 hypothetical protein CABS02_03054 [Colletotrichum abscissum]KAK1473558.1 hypothetical protein CABS01_04220 [Colletotrichum abscissum]
MVPKLPPFGALRLASPRDILRIGIVATAGFRYSPVFDWERPYHEKFPNDTILSYRHGFASALKSPDSIVLVAVDKFDPEESGKTKAIIPTDNGWEAPNAGDEVVVGVAYWKLEQGSKRIDEGQDDLDLYPELPACPDRDKHEEHYKVFGDRAEEAEHKQGVIAATMGKALFASMGYENLEDIKIEGDEVVPQGVTVSAMVFKPDEKPDESAEL